VMKKSALHFGLLISTAVLFSCTQVDVSGLDPTIFTNGGNGGNGGSTNALCDDVAAEFSTDVLPVFADKCAGSGCHTNEGDGGGLNLDDNDDTLGDGSSGVIGNIKSQSAINNFSAAQSALLLKPLASAEGGQSASHTGGQIFASTVDADYKKIFCWIDAGSKNDESDSECSFGEHVYPIFSNRGCTGCHDNSAPAGGLDLSQGSIDLLTATGSAGFLDNTGVVIAGDTDSLILQKPLLPMVDAGNGSHGGGAVLVNTQDPDYQKIKCWIDEGAQNN
jgi:hypothetical protein